MKCALLTKPQSFGVLLQVCFFHSAHYQISLSFHPHMAITLQLVSSYWVQIFAYNISELVTQKNFFIDVTKLSCIKSSCRHSSLSDLVSIKLVLT